MKHSLTPLGPIAYSEILGKILKSKQNEIRSLLKLKEDSPQKGKVEILGGQRNFKRDKSIPHFETIDGCWFDFAIIVDQTVNQPEIIGFNFEIRLPDDSSFDRFIRFDLNLPGHDNEAKRLRFHLHPGNDDIMIHSPPMAPLDILHLFLYGLSMPEKTRTVR